MGSLLRLPACGFPTHEREQAREILEPQEYGQGDRCGGLGNWQEPQSPENMAQGLVLPLGFQRTTIATDTEELTAQWALV